VCGVTTPLAICLHPYLYTSEVAFIGRSALISTMLVSPAGGTGDVRHGGSWRSCTTGSGGADEDADVAAKSIFRTHSLVTQEIA
jgi:hypothetical protein